MNTETLIPVWTFLWHLSVFSYANGYMQNVVLLPSMQMDSKINLTCVYYGTPGVEYFQFVHQLGAVARIDTFCSPVQYIPFNEDAYAVHCPDRRTATLTVKQILKSTIVKWRCIIKTFDGYENSNRIEVIPKHNNGVHTDAGDCSKLLGQNMTIRGSYNDSSVNKSKLEDHGNVYMYVVIGITCLFTAVVSTVAIVLYVRLRRAQKVKEYFLRKQQETSNGVYLNPIHSVPENQLGDYITGRVPTYLEPSYTGQSGTYEQIYSI